MARRPSVLLMDALELKKLFKEAEDKDDAEEDDEHVRRLIVLNGAFTSLLAGMLYSMIGPFFAVVVRLGCSRMFRKLLFAGQEERGHVAGNRRHFRHL